jgi:hypothetical protein
VVELGHGVETLALEVPLAEVRLNMLEIVLGLQVSKADVALVPVFPEDGEEVDVEAVRGRAPAFYQSLHKVPPALLVCEAIQMLQLIFNARSLQYIQFGAMWNFEILRDLLFDEGIVEILLNSFALGDLSFIVEVQSLLLQWLKRWTK